MKENDLDVIGQAARIVINAMGLIREVKFDPDAELNESDHADLELALLELDGGLTGLTTILDRWL